MGLGRDRPHVVHPSGPVIDLRDHDHRDLISDRVGQFFWGNNPQLMSCVQMGDQPLRHVQVGRKISAI